MPCAVWPPFFTRIYDGPFLYVCCDWYPHLRNMFGYFALGCFLMRHIDLTKLMDEKVFSLCLLYFCLSFVVHLPSRIMSISLQSVAAIYCCFFLLKECFTSGYIIDWFRQIGTKSLHIYILHLFFGIKLVVVGNFFVTLSQSSRMEWVTAVVLQLLFALLISIIIIEMCLFTSKLIKTSKCFSFILFGEGLGKDSKEK